jgi:hypothetical protein
MVVGGGAALQLHPLRRDAQLAPERDGAASIWPGKSVEDVVVFEEPVVRAEYLRLELPASAFGGTGKLRFQIPTEMIEKR